MFVARGCRDMFNDNPDKVIAEYVSVRKAAEKAKKTQ